MSNAFTYTGSPTTDLDKVRLLIGDTQESDVLLTDAEIEFFNEIEPNIFRAASKSAEAIAAKFSRQHSESVGKVKISFEQKFDHYIALSKSLKLQADRRGASDMSSGGISVSDKNVAIQDEDRVPPFFTRKLHDHPGVDDNGERLLELH